MIRRPRTTPATTLLLLSAVGLLLSFIPVVTEADGDMVRWIAPTQETWLPYAWTISYFGESTWYLVAAALLGLWCRFVMRHEAIWRLAAFCFAAIAGSGIFCNVLKVVFGRPRPRWLLEGQWGFDFFAWPPGDLSYPSGHSTIAAAVATCLALLMPRWWGLFALAALAIAVSRVFVGYHYLSDTIAGLATGLVFTLMVRNLFVARGWWPEARPAAGAATVLQ